MKCYFRHRQWMMAVGLFCSQAFVARGDFAVIQQTRDLPLPVPKVQAGGAVRGSTESAPSGGPRAGYISLTHPSSRSPDPNNNTLLICLCGHGDSAVNFVKVWLGLMRNHGDLVVAVPDINPRVYSLFNNTEDVVGAIVTDAVAHDHVNPAKIFLVGYSQGGDEGSIIVQHHPEWFAGFGAISCGELREFLIPVLKPYLGKLALYVNEGTGEGVDGPTFAMDIAALKYFGFTHVFGKQMSRGHTLVMDQFEPYARQMMAFFDQALADIEKSNAFQTTKPEAPPAIALPANVVQEERKLGNSAQATYVLLAPDRTTVPAPHDATLYICLHGPGDKGGDFAKNFYRVVGGRADVVVAVPNPPPLLAANLIKGIIDDTVARDQVNPRHVILVGHDLGGEQAEAFMAEHSNLFAGFAGISTSLNLQLITPSWQKNARNMAVYYAAGTKDEMFTDVYGPTAAHFRQRDFPHLLTESLDAGHAVTPEEIKHLVAFFDKELAAQDKIAAAAAAHAQEILRH